MFERLILSTVLCFVALRLAVAVEADATTTSASVPKNTAAATGLISAREAQCSKPPAGVDPAGCCNLATPFPGPALVSCQKAHVQWMNGWKNSTCGSQCLFNLLVNGSTLVQDIMKNPPEKWLMQIQNLNTYYDTISDCVKYANFEQFLPNLMSEGIAFQDVLCELNLLAVAECISKQLFLNCPVFGRSVQCQDVKVFLNTSCLYSDLFG